MRSTKNTKKYHYLVLLILWTSATFAQESNPLEWKLEYNGIKIQSWPAKNYDKADVQINIGEPFIIASKDDSQEEGYFVTPFAYNLGGILYVNWSFDRDVMDRNMPDKPNGRISFDGGITWLKHEELIPSDYKYVISGDPAWMATSILSYRYQTGENEAISFFRVGFEIPDKPGHFKVPTWRSSDNGLTWDKTEWTNIYFPGIKGFDPYNPPKVVFEKSISKKNRKPDIPKYLQPFYNDVSRVRFPGEILIPQASDSKGIIYSLSVGPAEKRIENFGKITDWDKDYWNLLDFERRSIYLHSSSDNGRTWTYSGLVAFDKNHEIEGESCFSEPSLVIYPDGEMVCVMRTGHYKPLYITRSIDKGKTWSKPQRLQTDEGKVINGIRPKLVLLENQVLVLATGRPDITVHFSRDKGNSWFSDETLYTVGVRRPGALTWPDFIKDTIYANSHQNVFMAPAGQNKVLVVHDATRRDESETHEWLQKHGHGLIIGRIITVNIPN